jgi:dTDP-L-rhamnose 4-epimerase
VAASALGDVDFIQGDVRDSSIVDKALDGCDAVVHLAAAVGVGQSMYQIKRYVDVNCIGTAVLLEAIVARSDRIKKLVVASSMSLYGEGAYFCEQCGTTRSGRRDLRALEQRQWEPPCEVCGATLRAMPTPENKIPAPESVYAVTKRDQEEICISVGRAYQIPTVALRFFNVYGPGQSLSNPYTGVAAIFCSRLLNGQPPVIYEDGHQSRDFVHVSDIVHGIGLALTTSTADYFALNLGSGNPVTVLQVADLLGSSLQANLTPIIDRRFRQGDIRHCFADIGEARRLLGYAPRVKFADGISELVEWVRSQTAVDHFAHAAAQLEDRGLTV